jgi:hypothetical protein
MERVDGRDNPIAIVWTWWMKVNRMGRREMKDNNNKTLHDGDGGSDQYI